MVGTTMNMREVRDTKRLKSLLKAGKVIVLRDRDKVIGRISPEHATASAPPQPWPDFAARAKAIFGDRKLDSVALFLQTRHRDE